jgi:pimeloyl-ACP methyl ester carboxylesterase
MGADKQMERGLVKTSMGYIHYRAAGTGNAIVLLHINQQSSALYLELMEVLRQRVRAVAIDYPSHGMSDHISFQPTIADYARCIVEVLDALGIERASALGEAAGAAVAIELAGAFPERVDKLVLVNCPYYRDSAVKERSKSQMKDTLRPADASGFPTTRTLEFVLEHDAIHAPMQPSQSWMDRINVAQIEVGRDRWQALGALHAYDIPGNLGRIASPVLLLMGEHFQYTAFRRELTARINDVQSDEIAGGRFCMTWEHAGEIGRRTLDFLQ